MIELDGIKAVRYTYEEIMRLKEKLKTEPYVDWLTPYVEEQYPNLTLITSMYDESRRAEWFLFASYDFHVISSVEIGEDGKPFLQERVELSNAPVYPVASNHSKG